MTLYYLRMIKEVILRGKGTGEEELGLGGRKGAGEMGPISWVISIITLVTMLYGVNPRLLVVPISLMVTEA